MKILSVFFFYDEMTRSVDEGKAVDVCNLDFSKIFNSKIFNILVFDCITIQRSALPDI